MSKKPGPKKISTTVYITPEQNEALKSLNKKTKVPIAEYIRQGINLILKQHSQSLPGQMLLLDDFEYEQSSSNSVLDS